MGVLVDVTIGEFDGSLCEKMIQNSPNLVSCAKKALSCIISELDYRLTDLSPPLDPALPLQPVLLISYESRVLLHPADG
jgi:hypothetical protein